MTTAPQAGNNSTDAGVPLKRKRRGILITLEGVEGSGKTTQFSRLARLLKRKGYRVTQTREPGGTPLAEAVRAIILSRTLEPMTAWCEALLILASRSQHVARVILPALRQSAIVLCDRFVDSTLAYQGYARGLDPSALRRMNHFATDGLSADLTLLFDTPVSTGLSRIGGQRRRRDRLEQERRSFHERVRRGYLALARKDPGRIKVVDGRPRPDIVAAQVEEIVTRFLRKRGRQIRKEGKER